jgi:hypothetical protein
MAKPLLIAQGERRRPSRVLAILLCVGLLLVAFGVGIAAASPSPPSIEGESVSGVTPTDATLEAVVDPQGAAHGVFYQFQLLPDPGEAPTELACPPSPPPGYSACIGPQSSGALPIGFASGAGPHSVTLELSSAGVTLAPGHKYFYRLLVAPAKPTEDSVEWEPPAVVGSSESFTTPEPPSILGESVSNVTAHAATLEAEIDPHEEGAYYQFQLASDPSAYASEILCPEPPFPGPFRPCIGTHAAEVLPIGFINEVGTVHLNLSSASVDLQPATLYHYRVLAARSLQTEDTVAWEGPSSTGADQTFTTASESPSAGGNPGSGSRPPSGTPGAGDWQHSSNGRCRGKKSRHRLPHRRAHRAHLKHCHSQRPSL